METLSLISFLGVVLLTLAHIHMRQRLKELGRTQVSSWQAINALRRSVNQAMKILVRTPQVWDAKSKREGKTEL